MEKEVLSMDVLFTAEEAANQLKKDEDVLKLLKERNLNSDVIDSHLIEIMDWVSQHRFCKNCQGLFMCDQDLEGMHKELDDDLSLIVTPCRHMVKRRSEFAHADNYLVTDATDNQLSAEISKIDLSKESADYKELVYLMKDWLLEQPTKGFYLYGGLGVGKTYLSYCVCNYLAKKGKKVAVVNMPKMASDLRNHIKEDDYVNNYLRSMKSAYLLVLDDIGAENITNWIRDDILFTVLDYRMENGKRTFFTSNSDINSLKKRMMTSNNVEDETKALRIIERIRTLSVPVGVAGKSRRDLGV